MLERIEQLAVYDCWPEAEEYLLRAVDDEDPINYIQGIKARVFSNVNQLWRVVDEGSDRKAYAVSNLYSSDGLLVISQIMMATADDLDFFVEHMDSFVSWSIQQGARYIEVIGRKGWEKILKPIGFNHNYTSLLKRIDMELH